MHQTPIRNFLMYGNFVPWFVSWFVGLSLGSFHVVLGMYWDVMGITKWKHIHNRNTYNGNKYMMETSFLGLFLGSFHVVLGMYWGCNGDYTMETYTVHDRTHT